MIAGTKAHRSHASPKVLISSDSPSWPRYYNFTRRHGALSHKPPAARLHELNNLAENYS
jgi:hypothetical protein